MKNRLLFKLSSLFSFKGNRQISHVQNKERTETENLGFNSNICYNRMIMFSSHIDFFETCI